VTGFVRASALYDVASGESIRHPAHDATPAELEAVVQEAKS
jgi:hypothetical protein